MSGAVLDPARQTNLREAARLRETRRLRLEMLERVLAASREVLDQFDHIHSSWSELRWAIESIDAHDAAVRENAEISS